MAFDFSSLVRRDFSGCDVLWFSQNSSFDPGTFVDDAPEIQPLGSFLSTGTWLRGRYGSDVVAATWQKAVEGRASGICVVQVKPSKPWGNLIKAGDALLIVMSSTSGSDKLRSTFVSLVFVDRVERGRTVDNKGATIELVSISGRDFGKIFEETATAFDPSFAQREQKFYTEASIQSFNKKLGLSPPEMILNFLDILYNQKSTLSDYVRMQWRFPGVEIVPIVALLDTITFVQVPQFGVTTQQAVDYVGAGNVWALLKSYSNDVVNELFVDVRDVNEQSVGHARYQEDLAKDFIPDPQDVDDAVALRQKVSSDFFELGRGVVSTKKISAKTNSPRSFEGEKSTIALVMRQKPYDTGSFRRLPTYVLDETEIVQHHTGHAQHNVWNFFRFSSASLVPAQLQELVFGIMVNPKSISRFGLRRFEIESQYVFTSHNASTFLDRGEMSKISYSGAYEYYVNLVATWNAFNENFDEGTIVSRFRPDIRVGCRLLVVRHLANGEDQTMEYYIASLKHSYMFEEAQSSSMFQVVRGVDYAAKGPESGLFWKDQGRYLSVEQPYNQLTDLSGFVKPENVPGRDPKPASDKPFLFIPPGTKL